MNAIKARFNRNVIAAIFDSCMAALSFLLALYIRLGDDMSLVHPFIPQATVMFTLICCGVFVYMRFYRGLWRYASLRDMVAIGKSVTLAILVFASLLFLINRLENMPRSVFFIQWMMLIGMLAGPRFLYRAVKDRSLTWEMKLNETVKVPVLIIGGNDNAEQFIRDTERNPAAPYRVVGIADDDPKQKGRSIHQVMIYGDTTILPTIVRKLDRKGNRPQKLVLADDKATGEKVRRLLAVADELGIPLARLPKLSQFKSGVSERPDIKPIAVEDLLGRPQNVQDRSGMRALVEGKTVMITGAGGTIGSELARQSAALGPARLVLVEQCEYNLYKIDNELRRDFPLLALEPVLCDVRNQTHVRRIFEDLRPQIVLHAAAIKHVPLAECNVEETILTNVFGTHFVADSCVRHNVEAMVMISTDKAVHPCNVMGATKRLAESLCQAMGEGQAATRFVTVRFGNVLGSTGSVVPLFSEQIARGGPVTVTHPDITRYFMTTREAVELVLQAAALGQSPTERGRGVFVLDMGEPVKILDLATQMIRLAGLHPGEDIKITFSGLRPGEKLYEELFYGQEKPEKTAHESIFLAYPPFADMKSLQERLHALFSACETRRADEALALLKQLVPEFNHTPNP